MIFAQRSKRYFRAQLSRIDIRDLYEMRPQIPVRDLLPTRKIPLGSLYCAILRSSRVNFDHALAAMEYVSGIVCQLVEEADSITVH
jgi:hypothetical protein